MRILFVPVVFLATAPFALGQAPCPVITKSAKLAANCAAPLVVQADNVFVDLGGRTVSCTAAAPYIGIDVQNRRKVRIENGFVNDCVRGVNIVGGGQHLVKKVTLRQTLATPLTAATSYGLWVENSTSNWFEAVMAEKNDVGGDVTIGSFDNTLKGVKFTKNNLDGLQLDLDATDNDVKESTFSENGRFGIFFGLRAARNTIYRNHIERNGWVGLIPDSANVVEKNVVRANGGSSDPAAWVRGGIVLFGSNNIITDNDANENKGLGIAAGFSPGTEEAVANTITKNQAKATVASPAGVRHDMADFPSGICTQNDWGGNDTVLMLDGCEKRGGDTPNYHVTGAGTAADNFKFQFNVQRRDAGAAYGPVKIEELFGSVKVEGRASCLAVRPADAMNPLPAAIVGMIIEKSSNPALAPVYQTLHFYVEDSAVRAADGSPLDTLALAPLNSLGPGDCDFGLFAPANPQPISKGAVVIKVR